MSMQFRRTVTGRPRRVLSKAFALSLQENETGYYFNSSDDLAYTTLFNRFYRPLCFFAMRLIRDNPAAQDLVSDIFLKLWVKQISFETLTKAKAWLYISTRNACFNYIKRPNNLPKDELKNDIVFSDDTVLTEMIKSEVLRDIVEMIEFLPPECRKIVKLSFFDGYDNDKIANMLCLSVHTVKNQKARAIYLLRKRRSVSLLNR